MNTLIQRIDQNIQKRQLIRPGEPILVAVSGGLDSMVLLHLLHSLARANRWRLRVAHFNHLLRGNASDADERLVRRVARRLRLRLVRESGDVRAHAAEHGVSIEMAARALRHEFLARTARSQNMRTVALAHHADDQVELFFLRLLRGAGSEGLGGMKWRSPSSANRAVRLIRPLLDTTKAELESFAREAGLQFREDESNHSLDPQRNRIRLELLPCLRQRYQTALGKVVLRTMDILGDEAEVVTQAAMRALKDYSGSLSDHPIGVQRRVLQLQLQSRGLPVDYELVEALRLTVGRSISAGPRVFVSRDEHGKLSVCGDKQEGFDSTEAEIRLEAEASQTEFEGVQFNWRLEPWRKSIQLKNRSNEERFDAAKIGTSVVLRHWRPGDRFQPLGMPATVKLQDWFINQKIERGQRHRLIVATTASGTIFWIEGQRIDARFKVTENTESTLRWRWARGNSQIAVHTGAC